MALGRHTCQVSIIIIPYRHFHLGLGLVISTAFFHLLMSVGLGVGGIWGLREGYKRPLAVSSTRLRINSVLNSVTRRGTFLGNSAGVMG